MYCTDTDTDILYIGDFRIGFWVLDNVLIWASRLDILVYNNSIKVYKKVNKFYEKKSTVFFVLAPQGKKGKVSLRLTKGVSPSQSPIPLNTFLY